MSRACVRARVAKAALVLLLPGFLAFPARALAQQAKVSFRVAPFGAKSATPLFKVDIVKPPARGSVALPSLTVMETATGPRLTNVALLLPDVTVGNTAVASRLGDQPWPRTFVASPLSGTSVKRPMRGVSFSTAGATPWSFSLGQLDAGTGTAALSSRAPSIMAFAVGLKPHHHFSVAPRLLVPVGSAATRTSIGTAIQAELTPHVTLVSDVGAAGRARAGWDPLAAAGVVGHWAGAEIETNVLRGAPSLGPSATATIDSLDRELIRGQSRHIPGVTISGLAAWSRPASAPHAADTTVGSIGIAYDRLPYGQVAATSRREASSSRQVNTTRVEWRRTPVGGFVVRYVVLRQTHREALQAGQSSKQVEIDFPGWTGHDPGTRVNVQAVLTADPSSANPTLSSRLTGRFDVFGQVGLAGETELGMTGTDGKHPLRKLRVTSEVPVMRDTAVQVLYTYRAGTPYLFDQSFEARISRTIQLFRR
jgi:hypothetical protein